MSAEYGLEKTKAHWMRLECGFCGVQYTPDVIEGIVVIRCPIEKCGKYENQTILQTTKD